MKPILFNTDMVKAILEGRKTVTRRVVKPLNNLDVEDVSELLGGDMRSFSGFYCSPLTGVAYWRGLDRQVTIDGKLVIAPFTRKDTLYVREAWQKVRVKKPLRAVPDDFREVQYLYLADGEIANSDGTPFRWRPSIHMPKEAARIFLRVTDVRVEPLQAITEAQALQEGCTAGPIKEDIPQHISAKSHFKLVWNSTIKPADLPAYGWDANPRVWVIEFERCDKEGDT